MKRFGRLPRTTVLDGPPTTGWTARNSLAFGIKIYSGLKNGVGIWAQELYEWRKQALFMFLSLLGFAVAIAGYYLKVPYYYLAAVPSIFAGAYFILSGNAREIYSHAITVQTGQLFGIDYELEALHSLMTYDWIKDPSPDELLRRMQDYYPKARAWAESQLGLLRETSDQIA